MLLAALWMMTVPVAGYAQTQTATSALTEEEKLERDFTDPLSTLPQLLVRDSYTPANYGPGPCTSQVCFRDYETNQFLVRPLIPRIPPNSLLPFSQLIRPTFQLVTVQSSRGGTRTEFGDLPVFDVAVLPWPDRQKTGLLIGVGPTFVFPTATSKSAGQGAWQAGPALGAIYYGIPGLLVGFVAQNPVALKRAVPPSSSVWARGLSFEKRHRRHEAAVAMATAVGDSRRHVRAPDFIALVHHRTDTSNSSARPEPCGRPFASPFPRIRF